MALAERITLQKDGHTVTVFQIDARELRAQGYVPVGEAVADPAPDPDAMARTAITQLAGTDPRRKK